MCILCVEDQRERLMPRELVRNFKELFRENVSDHAREVADKIADELRKKMVKDGLESLQAAIELDEFMHER